MALVYQRRFPLMARQRLSSTRRAVTSFGLRGEHDLAFADDRRLLEQMLEAVCVQDQTRPYPRAL